MQLIHIDLSYDFNTRVRGLNYKDEPEPKALNEQEYETLRERFNLPPFERRTELSAHRNEEHIGTIEDVEALTKLGFSVSVKRVRGMYVDSTQELGKLSPEIGGTAQVVNVIIPNAALFAVQKLMVVEDECTNRVQEHLDNGWRIVAVCPPNDTRRPTFILGHMDNNPRSNY